jgi:hypothetical protein
LASRGLGDRLDNVELKMINGVLAPNNGPTLPPHQRQDRKIMPFELECAADDCWSRDSGDQARAHQEKVAVGESSMNDIIKRVDGRVDTLERKLNGVIPKGDK